MADLVVLADRYKGLFGDADYKCLRQAGVQGKIIEAAGGAATAGAERASVRAERAERWQAALAEVEAQREAELRTRVDVDIVGVVVGPVALGNAPWDGMTPPSTRTVNDALKLAAALGAVTPVAAGTSELTTYAMETLSASTAAPDVFGYAEYLGPDAPVLWQNTRLSLRRPESAQADSYYATFPGSPGYRGLKFEEGDSLRIVLYDADLTDSETIGTIDITRSDIETAAGFEGIVEVNVAARTRNQVLAVQIAVRPATSATPVFKGATFTR